DTVSKVCIRFFFTQIFKGQDGDRFALDFSCESTLPFCVASLRMQKSKGRHSCRQSRDDSNQSREFAPGLARDSAIDVPFELNSLRCHLERPRTNHGDRKTDDHGEDDHLDCPIRQLEEWKDLRRNLDQQPRYDGISDRNLVNIAPLQLGEEVARIHSSSTW